MTSGTIVEYDWSTVDQVTLNFKSDGTKSLAGFYISIDMHTTQTASTSTSTSLSTSSVTAAANSE